MNDLDTQAARYGHSGWWTRLHVILAEVGPGPTPPAWYTAKRLRDLAQVANDTADKLDSLC